MQLLRFCSDYDNGKTKAVHRCIDQEPGALREKAWKGLYYDLLDTHFRHRSMTNLPPRTGLSSLSKSSILFFI